jgi:hypothetical protein
VLLALAALLAILLAVRARTEGRRVIERQVKVTHVLPASIQTVIYAYWGLYWPLLHDYLPALGLQVVFALLLDAVVGLAVHRRWRASFGPLPIVLSTGLFIQFASASWMMTYAAITVAILSKSLLRRDGRPVFNPSALGVSVVGLVNLIWPSLGNGDIALAFHLPPNMGEVIVLLALVVQLRLPIVTVTLAATAGLVAHDLLADIHVFSPFWSPVTLVVVLLATDPATSPRSAGGRLLYGLTLGLGMGYTGELLTVLGQSDFYGKVLPLPVVNALAPSFDRAAAWLSRFAVGPDLRALRAALQPRWNRVHVGLWLGIFALGLSARGKVSAFDGPSHLQNGTRFLRTSEAGASCTNNPLYCKPFSLTEEARCWATLLADPPGSCPSGRSLRVEGDMGAAHTRRSCGGAVGGKCSDLLGAAPGWDASGAEASGSGHEGHAATSR